MLAVSERSLKAPFSPIRKLKPFADEVVKKGRKIYHLNIGQPDISTPARFIQGVRSDFKVLSYSPSPGYDEARKALASYYQGVGLDLKYEEIFVTAGGSEAIIFALLATTDPGDEILVPEPFYASYKGYAAMADIKIVPLETSVEDGFRLPGFAEIEAKITRKTKAILFCSPGNPTGVVYTQDELEMLRDLALKHSLYLISDEVYREFVYDGAAHTSIFDLDSIDEHAILVDSISKRFSACGARIGAIASRNKDLMQAVLKFAQARLSPPSLGQVGLINLLNSPSYMQEIENMVVSFRERRDVLIRELQKIPGVVCRMPEGAFYLIVKLPVKSAEEFCAWLLRDFDFEGETLMLAPAGDFYATPGKGQDEVRIAYVLNTTDLKKAAAVLKAGLTAYNTLAFSQTKL